MSRYRERVVWTDNELKLKLLRKALLTRIYAPMVRQETYLYSFTLCRIVLHNHAFFQVIIQGLKESGVFINTIAMALSNATESLSSSVLKSGAISSRKIGQKRETMGTRRRVLLLHDNFHPRAVPPQSPPLLEDIQVAI